MPSAGTLELEVDVDADTLAKRRNAWKPRETNYQSGACRRYAQMVGSAQKGGVCHPGANGETHIYADL